MYEALQNRLLDTASEKPRLTKRKNYLPNTGNLRGRPLDAPKKGAKGLAGIRADLLDGTITVREFSMLSLLEISRRYRVWYPASASYCKRYIAKYGLAGAKRAASSAISTSDNIEEPKKSIKSKVSPDRSHTDTPTGRVYTRYGRSVGEILRQMAKGEGTRLTGEEGAALAAYVRQLRRKKGVGTS